MIWKENPNWRCIFESGFKLFLDEARKTLLFWFRYYSLSKLIFFLQLSKCIKAWVWNTSSLPSQGQTILESIKNHYWTLDQGTLIYGEMLWNIYWTGIWLEIVNISEMAIGMSTCKTSSTHQFSLKVFWLFIEGVKSNPVFGLYH